MVVRRVVPDFLLSHTLHCAPFLARHILFRDNGESEKQYEQQEECLCKTTKTSTEGGSGELGIEVDSMKRE